eukprot:1405228-Lingulodinium_polyedra.AAC.1
MVTTDATLVETANDGIVVLGKGGGGVCDEQKRHRWTAIFWVFQCEPATGGNTAAHDKDGGLGKG